MNDGYETDSLEKKQRVPDLDTLAEITARLADMGVTDPMTRLLPQPGGLSRPLDPPYTLESIAAQTGAFELIEGEELRAKTNAENATS